MSDGAGPGPRILLVEDEPVNRALVRAMIERANRPRLRGAELLEAASIAEARAALAVRPFDILLLDVRLPDGNGFDLVAELRAAGGLAATRVIIVSASVLATERAVAVASGAEAFLGKPFLAAELLDLLEGQAAPGG
ncbi:MAG: response regulator [Chloroflexota bacterium]